MTTDLCRHCLGRFDLADLRRCALCRTPCCLACARRRLLTSPAVQRAGLFAVVAWTCPDCERLVPPGSPTPLPPR